MPTQINGLPAHVLLIHVVVVLVPLGALFTVLSAVWPAARRRLGVVSPLTCLIALAFVPVTTNAGHWLADRLQSNGPVPAIQKHMNLGESFLWYALLLFVVSAAVWWVGRTYEPSPFASTSRSRSSQTSEPTAGAGGVATATRARTTQTALPVWAAVATTVIVVVVAGLVVWQLYRVGDSGAHAAWDYVQQLKK